MSYWENARSDRRLLCSVSTIALLAVIGGADSAAAGEPGQGIWSLALQGQYDFDDTGASRSFTPSAGIPDTSIHPRNGLDAGGKLTYQPAGSPYSYAIGLRYGRARNVARDFADIHPTAHGTFNQAVGAEQHLSHTMLDFEIGRDVGIGLFGTGTTTVGGGLRFARFDSATRASFSTSSKYTPGRAGEFDLSRRTDLFGPRLFARTTSPLPGDLGARGISLGVGAGAGLLFGRQSARNEVHLSAGSTPAQFAEFSRSRQVTVPTIDASAQLNWAVPRSPLTVSAGYRYDAAYQVLDGGAASGSHNIDSVQHGPFLSLAWKLN